jgi:hypothetical protein
MWDSHKVVHREMVCSAPGCDRPGTKRCPVCKEAGERTQIYLCIYLCEKYKFTILPPADEVYTVCSQECLNAVWHTHKRQHESTLATKRAPVFIGSHDYCFLDYFTRSLRGPSVQEKSVKTLPSLQCEWVCTCICVCCTM